MHIYILALIISLLLSYMSIKVTKKKWKLVFQILSALPLFIVSAIRYDVGTDYIYRYKGDFEYIKSGGAPFNLEIGFLLMVKLCLLLSDNFELLIVVTSAIVIFMIFFLIYKYSKKPMLSIFIFFAGCFFFQSMNVIRQYIACSIVLLSYQLLIERKYKLWIPCITVAALMHTTSIVSVIAIFLTKKIIAKPNVIIIMTIIILAFGGLFNNLINMALTNTRFAVYIGTNFNRQEVKYIALVVNILLYGTCYYLLKSKNKIKRKDILYINIMGASVIFAAMGNIYFLFNRLAYYFTIIQIISVPYFIYVDERIYKDIIIERKKNVIITLSVILLLTANIFYTNLLHNDDEVLPYKTIFEK